MTPQDRRNLYVYNGGLLTGRRLRRILELAGWDVRLGLPGPEDWVGVWGASPTAPRGLAVARRADAPVLRIEDAFLRSVRPGRSGEPPLGLVLDRTGLHFDPTRPSDIETLLARAPLDDTAMLDAARAQIARMCYWNLGKYNDWRADLPLPRAPYVLVIDQVRGDASVTASGADRATFLDMLVRARAEHPGMKVLIKAHPETAAGHRPGHFTPEDAAEGVEFLTDPLPPQALLEGAVAVYTVSSQLGFEAIFAGHRPRVFGQPFYAGWGLTDDLAPIPRRGRNLTRAQLFAGAMMLYPTWYDPFRDALCSVDQVIDTLAAAARAHDEDRHGYLAIGFARWKRPHMRRIFGTGGGIRFVARAPEDSGARVPLHWGARPQAALPRARSVEDGFLRSVGLGERLVPPLSLVSDDLGIYFDPRHPSRLEALIAAAPGLPAAELDRAGALIGRIRAAGLTKYNLPAGAELPDLPAGHRILVPGQVEADASITLGADAVTRNADLLRRARAANPGAVVIYKAHPDVAAGLRRGAVDPALAAELADVVIEKPVDNGALIDAVDAVWTMTSTLGFEALIRGKRVTCLGMPFYAGWGLTEDLGVRPLRRKARPDLLALVHACLIGYPRYFDPVTGRICPPEVALERLAEGPLPRSAWNRILAGLASLRPTRP